MLHCVSGIPNAITPLLTSRFADDSIAMQQSTNTEETNADVDNP